MPDSTALPAEVHSTEGLERVALPDDVREVCSANDLWAPLAIAVNAALKFFRPVQDLRAEVDVDPDTDERRVVLDVTADAPLDDMLRRYDEYTREWVMSVPADKRDWVRLCFHTHRGD